MRTARRTTIGLAAALLLVGGSTACGSGSTTSTQGMNTADWADGVCTAAVSYRSSLKTIGTSLKSTVPSKSSLSEAAAQAKSSTHVFVDSLQGLGKPGTTSGAKAKQTVDDLATSLHKQVSTIQNATSSGTGVVNAVSVVSTALVTAKNDVVQAVDHLRQLAPKDELAQAFSQAPACSSLKSG
jgi:hypothetical protein